VRSKNTAPDGLTLIERCAGVGELGWKNEVFPRIRYEVSRFQGLSHSGMPIPGLHRIEGSVDLAAIAEPEKMIGSGLTLRLEDGRLLGITLAGKDGRILTEGHGPSKCSCC